MTSNQRAHYSDLDRNGSNDTSQPRKPRPFPGVPGGISRRPRCARADQAAGAVSPPPGSWCQGAVLAAERLVHHALTTPPPAGGSDDYDSGEYYESGDPETILARHG